MNEALSYVLGRLSDLWPLVVAIGCGGVIGLEREWHGKPAGVRTTMLICMGSAAFVQVGSFVTGTQGDPTRVLGQVITGIGFLGAGSIITHRGQVVGLTTAATIWVTAAVGVALGLGYYVRGIAWTVLAVLILQGLGYLEYKVRANGFNGRNGKARPDEPDDTEDPL